MYNLSHLLTQKQRNDVIASISDLFIYDAGLTYALTNDAFQICIALSNIARRSISASTLSMNVLYYGSQNLTVGTLTNVVTAKTATNVGAIVGGVIGGVVGLCLLITVIAIIVALVLILRRKHVNTKSEVPENHDVEKGDITEIPLALEHVDTEQPAILHEPVQIDQVKIEINRNKPLESEVLESYDAKKNDESLISLVPEQIDIEQPVQVDQIGIKLDQKNPLEVEPESVEEQPAIPQVPVQVNQIEIKLDQEKLLKAEVVEEQSVEQEQVIIQSSPVEEEVSLTVQKDLGEIS
jgi:hypothetical protein